MSDQIDAYIDAGERCNAAFATLDRLRTIVVQVADALQNDAEHFGFSNTPHSG